MAFEPLPAAKRATEQGERFQKAAEAIRSRTDLTAKGLAGLGTGAVTAIGYTKFADVFPYGGPWWSVPILVLGVVAMIGAVVFLVLRFQKVGEPIRTSADLVRTFEMNALSAPEQEKLKADYKSTAKLNGVRSLLAYQARAHRFERIADRETTDAKANSLRARADVIRGEVLTTQTRAVALILRERAKEAFFSWAAAGLLLVFILGWYGTALAADAIQSERTDRVNAAKLCAETQALGPAVELPEKICGETPDDDEEPTAADARVDAIAALHTAYGECLQKAQEEDAGPTACAPLKLALDAADAEG
jgi:hypothetical protein